MATINVRNKTFAFPAAPVIVKGEKGTETLVFNIQDSDTDLTGAVFYLCFSNARGESEVQPMTASGENWTWTINANFTHAEGYNSVQLMAKVGDTIVWRTKTARVAIYDNVETIEPIPDMPTLWIDLVSARDTAVQKASEASASAVTASLKATLAEGYAQVAEDSAEDAEDAKNDAVSAKNDAVSAKNDAVSAKNDAVSAKDTAVQAKTDAQTAQAGAESARQKIESMTVSSQTLPAGSSASVTKTEQGGVVNLAFGIPKGDKGDTGEKGAKGDTGATGAKGDKGDTGAGVPSGGAAGQVLKKRTGTDFDTQWTDESGAVLSVNGKTGTVVLDAEDVGALGENTKYGSALVVEMNTSTYVITATLKDQDGNTLGQSQSIDLPLESVVVSGSYDSVHKKVILTLKNGSAVEFSVADLVSGLATSAELTAHTGNGNVHVTTQNKSDWNAKYDKPDGGIPKSDMTSDVQTSLGKADTAIQDISGKVDKVAGKGLSTNDYDNAEKTLVASALQPADVVDNATSTDTDKPASARVAKTLKDAIDNDVQPKITDDVGELASIDFEECVADSVAGSLSSNGADTIAEKMSSNGADTIAEKMSSNGADTISLSMSDDGINNIFDKAPDEANRFIARGIPLDNNFPFLPFLNMISDVVPASASATGTKGQVVADNSYVYICTADNVWCRIAKESW